MGAAWSDGIGSCPNTPTDEGAVKRLLGVPDEMAVATIISLGYQPPVSRDPDRARTRRACLDGSTGWALAELVHREAYGTLWASR